jgi:signal transduction histidine kinase/ligand-binding sensor domain-containing protein/DNA-binding response OmpR family regulator
MKTYSLNRLFWILASAKYCFFLRKENSNVWSLFSLFIFFLGFHKANAQFRFDRINTQDGLSQSSVWRIYQDKQGFMWFATYDGLNRFDGYNFTTFRNDPADSTSLSSNEISAIFEDSKGRFWVGTRAAGLQLFDRSTGKFKRFFKDTQGYNISNISINNIAEDAQHHVYFTSSATDFFFCRFNENLRTIEKVKLARTPASRTDVMLLDSKKRFWVATNNGELLLMKGKDNYESYQLRTNSPERDGPRDFIETPDGNLLIATQGNGIFKFDVKTKSFQQVLYDPAVKDSYNLITKLAFNKAGNLWVATDGGAFFVPKGDFSKKIYIRPDKESEQGLSTHALMDLFIDNQENIWIGTWEGGLNVLYKNQHKFSIIRRNPTISNTLPDNRITGITTDGEGNLWVSSGLGVCKIDKASKNVTSYKNRTAGNDVGSIIADAEGDIFISIWQHGFAYLPKGSNDFVTIKDEKLSLRTGINVTTLGRYQGSKIFVGLVNGLIFVFDKQTKSLTPLMANGQPLKTSHVYCFLYDEPSKNLWIGTFANGLYRYNIQTQSVDRFSKSLKNLADNHVFTIYKNRKNEILIGTNGGGLQVFNSEKNIFENYLNNQSLPSNAVKGIIEDPQGNLWVSSNDGLSRISTDRQNLRNYSISDGLQGKEFMNRACHRTADGTMYFGGSNGINYFNVNNLTDNPVPPKVYITGFKIFNKTVEVGPESALTKEITQAKDISLKYNQSVFSFDFTALDFQQSKNNRYAYKMEGFDRDWNEIGTNRSAYYTNLDEGDYTFLVKATNNDGVWSTQPATINIHISPPWFRSPWAYIVYGLLATLGFFAIIRLIEIREDYRTNIRIKELEKEQAQAIEKLKSEFFTNISHEFRTPLTLIISPLERFLIDYPLLSEKQNIQLSNILANARRLLKLINQLLDIAKLESGRMTPHIAQNDIVEYVNKLVGNFEIEAERKQINLSFEASSKQLMAWFDADIIEKVVSNLLSNAFRFTPAEGFIKVKIIQESADSLLKISVSDSGSGISGKHLPKIFDRFYQVDDSTQAKGLGSGVGLALCKELIELHKGQIKAKSELGKGTVFEIEVPVQKEAFDPAWISETIEEVEKVSVRTLANQLFTTQRITMTDATNGIEKDLLLLVEDNEELRAYLREIFEGKFRILEASNGQIGHQLANQHIPDLVISDWIMPEMTGDILCSKLKTEEATSHIPVILLTSKSSNESRAEGLTTGADDYITKPFNASLLEIRVKNLLESRKRLRQRFSKQVTLQPKDLSITPADEVFLKKAVEVIERHIDDSTFDAEQLEEALSLSKMQLYRKLKSLTDTAPQEFIRNIRLKRAVQLLGKKQFTVSEVAYRTGFNDPAYFTRVFKKQFGKAPTEYLEQTAE